MDDRRQRLGRTAEDLAAAHLQRNGYRILTRNYRAPMGEIDIIAREGEAIVFVEVKARRTARYGSPKEAVTAAKRRTISMVALHYLKRSARPGTRARFDVVSILFSDPEPRIDIIRNAFDLAYS